MLRRSSQPQPWGYLLPMRDGLPALELRLEKSSVGSDVKCTLRLDPACLQRLGLSPRDTLLLQITREETRVAVRDGTRDRLLTVDGRSAAKHMAHGSLIGLREQKEPLYVFVDNTVTVPFEAPQKLLKNYVVAQRLGGGGFGQVYLLFEKKSKLQKRCAVKYVQLVKESERKFAERERKILQKVKHPCIIDTYDEYRENLLQFFIMEFLPGGDLSQFVDIRPRGNLLINEVQMKLIFFQLALAVQYLHQSNICHRDLKPANILLQRRDPHTLIKVTDFGLAKGGDTSALATLAGTEPFLAPEIMTDQQYTKEVDVWSMGVILFLALSGALPFPGGISEAMRHQHIVNYPTQLWQGVSMKALDLVRDMLKPSAAKRLAINHVVEHAWMQDDAMREEAYKLTGIKRIRPAGKKAEVGLAAASEKTGVPRRMPAPGSAQAKPRPLSGPRGVLEHWHAATEPSPAAPVVARVAQQPTPPLKVPVRQKEVIPPRVAGLAARQPAGLATRQPAPPPRNPANIRGAPLGGPAFGRGPGPGVGGVPAALNGQAPRPVHGAVPRGNAVTPPPKVALGANALTPGTTPAHGRAQKTFLIDAKNHLKPVPRKT